MADVSHRTVTEDVYDGTTGAKVEEKTVHQIGITVDGVFAPFVSKEGSYVERLVELGLRQQDAEAKAKQESGSDKSDTTGS